MILLGILFDFIPTSAEIFMYVFLAVFMYSYCPTPSCKTEKEEEDDLHAIRRMLEEDRKQKESSKPSSPYTDMTDEELRRRAEEAERSMKRMR